MKQVSLLVIFFTELTKRSIRSQKEDQQHVVQYVLDTNNAQRSSERSPLVEAERQPGGLLLSVSFTRTAAFLALLRSKPANQREA